MLQESEFTPDVVILDLNIPKISGYGVLARYPLEQAPVVVFTASDNPRDMDRAFSLGASGYIRKPMDLDEYKSAVFDMIEKWLGYDER